MAARKTRGTKLNRWSDEHRERISTTMLIKRLTDHITGKIALDATQVRGIEILLRKTVPDLAAVDMRVKGEIEAQLVDFVTSLAEQGIKPRQAQDVVDEPDSDTLH